MDIIIIGGGASGIFAAINLKKYNNNVRILEKNSRIGKKLLVTGNGRCNYSNINLSENNYNKPEFVKNAIDSFSNTDLVNYFKMMGLYSCVENNRIYPITLKANSVLSILMKKLSEKNICINTDTEVLSVSKEKDKFKLITNKGEFYCHKLIVACGGSSMPKSGSDGSFFKILKKLGHRVSPIFPALTQIKLESAYLKHLQGTKVVGKVKLYSKEKLIIEKYGDLLFTSYGISGPPILDISVKLSEYNDLYIEMPLINYSDKIDKEEIFSSFYMFNDYSIDEFLLGLVDKKFIHYILETLGIKSNTPLNFLEKFYSDIIDILFNSKFYVKGTTGFENSQVTRGGVDISEVSPFDFSSKICDGLYIIGEALDVDGECGGYNLHFAFACAYTLSKNFNY